MKKFTKIAAVLLALLMCGPLFGQYDDDDEPAPGRRYRRSGIMNKTLSVGLLGSANMKTDVLDSNDDVIQSIEDEAKTVHGGLSVRFFPFMGGKLGAGMDIIYLQSFSIGNFDIIDYMVDFNLLLRFKVGRRLTVNGGIGWSQYLSTWEDTVWGDTGSEWGKLGFNVKVGAEYFFARNWSITGDFKWTHFTYENWDSTLAPLGEEITYRYLSFVVGVHYWL